MFFKILLHELTFTALLKSDVLFYIKKIRFITILKKGYMTNFLSVYFRRNVPSEEETTLKTTNCSIKKYK